MKKQRGFLTLCLMLTFFLGNVTGQIHEPYKQFPALPDRPFVPPAAGQLQAWQGFQSSHPSWQIRWDKETGAPASVATQIALIRTRDGSWVQPDTINDDTSIIFKEILANPRMIFIPPVYASNVT